MLTKILAAVAAALAIGGAGVYVAHDYYGGCPLSSRASAPCPACDAAEAACCTETAACCEAKEVCCETDGQKVEAKVEAKAEAK